MSKQTSTNPIPTQSGDLAGKVALITGGSKGIGLATAIRFAREGARVAILARGIEALNRAVADIEAAAGPGTVLGISCDVTDETAVQQAFAKTLAQFGRLDVVVNNAGSGFSALVGDTTLADLNAMLAIHVIGYFLVAREAVGIFKRQGTGGAMVFVCSDSSVKAGKRSVAYNSAKAAELQMARCLAEECGADRIRVNSVLPGAVFGSSEFWTDAYRQARASAYGFDPSKLEIEYKKNTALKETILPEEVAEAILFLASDRSNKITGAALGIDGGGAAAYVR